VNWDNGRNYFLIAVILYGLSAVYSIFLLRKGFRKDNRTNYFLLLAAAGLHTLAMFKRGFSLERCPINNLYEATILIGWAMVMTYLVVGIWSRLRFLGAFVSPVLFGIGVFALIVPALDVHGPKPQFTGGWLSLHVTLFALAYASFGLSSVAGLMYLMQEHNLKFHKLRAVFSLMPPIQRLEIAASRLLLGGFLMLSAALAVSAIWFKQIEGVYFNGDAKILWSVFVWLLYLALVVMRWKYSQLGRRFAWGSIAGFVFVVLTFWGSSLLSPIHRP